MPNPSHLNALIDSAPLSDAWRALARRGLARSLRKDTTFIVEGDQGGALYILLKGELRAFGSTPDERELTYGRYGPGQVVGEMSLDGGARSAHVEATVASVVVLVTRQTLLGYLSEQPAFAFELLAQVITRAREATSKLHRMALTDAYGRLKRLVEDEHTRQEAARPAGGSGLRPETGPSQPASAEPLVLALTHAAIANELGCTRERVSHLLKSLERAGYVSLGKRQVVLLKPLPARQPRARPASDAKGI
jgi:CRP/FNR family transcriptional regulator, cyclic AMP receptor protein